LAVAVCAVESLLIHLTFVPRLMVVNRSEYKTPFCGLQDLRL
jgi:hypothetical protein